MNRTETYCDRCGRMMSYCHSDGDQAINGIQLRDPLVVTFDRRTDSGSSGMQKAVAGTQFCSTACFTEAVADVLTAAHKFIIEPLK